jgi:hypothetical protein
MKIRNGGLMKKLLFIAAITALATSAYGMPHNGASTTTGAGASDEAAASTASGMNSGMESSSVGTGASSRMEREEEEDMKSDSTLQGTGTSSDTMGSDVDMNTDSRTDDVQMEEESTGYGTGSSIEEDSSIDDSMGTGTTVEEVE